LQEFLKFTLGIFQNWQGSNLSKSSLKFFNNETGCRFETAIQENGYRTLNEGETVEFELLKGPKGFLAANVLRGSAN
jgi:cold shock CspA family protein